jgi:hypothetical protein
MEVTEKRKFAELVKICAGVRPSTPEELRLAIDTIFTHILAFRASFRLEGDFLECGLEERITELERRQDAINNVIQQFIQWLRWYRGPANQ